MPSSLNIEYVRLFFFSVAFAIFLTKAVLPLRVLPFVGFSGYLYCRDLSLLGVLFRCIFDSNAPFLSASQKVMKESHEFMYNAACCYIESGSLDAASQCLDAAASICRESMKRDGASEQEILDELAVIQAQQAYISQRRGKEKEAMEQYEEILKHNVSDSTVVAVCSNNIVALRGEHDRFNSLNKLKHLSSDQVQEKLSFSQKKSIYFNRCVLFLQMNKLQECRDLLKSFEADFADSEYIPLLNAALLVREKHWDEAQKVLTEFISQKRGKDCVRVQLSLAQVQLTQGSDLAAVIATLKSIEALKNTPAMISALAKLLELSGDVEGALRAVDEAAAKISADVADESAIQMLKKTVDFKMKNRRHREAAMALEKILKSNPGDVEALPKLVIAYAAFDADQAEKYAKRLPQQKADKNAPVDVDKLENIAPRVSYKKIPADVTVLAATEDATVKKDKKKKKKKKKNPPATKADLSRPADPERWLPKRERSYYKGPRRRGQKNVGGARSLGAQGSTSVSDAHSQAVRGTPLAKAKDEEPTPTPAAAAPAAPKQPPRAVPKKGRGGRKR